MPGWLLHTAVDWCNNKQGAVQEEEQEEWKERKHTSVQRLKVSRGNEASSNLQAHLQSLLLISFHSNCLMISVEPASVSRAKNKFRPRVGSSSPVIPARICC